MKRPAGASLRIGEVAERMGVSTQTIRYYERRGLLQRPQRSASGYRQYDRSTLDRLRFVRRAQRLGFSLAEIGELLELHARRDDQCADVRTQIDIKLDDVESRLRDLQRMRAALQELREECERADPNGACPMLEVLAGASVESSD